MIKYFIILNFLAVTLFAQNIPPSNKTAKSITDTSAMLSSGNSQTDEDWNDTTFKQIILLKDPRIQKIIEFNQSKNAIIYLSYPDFKNLCYHRMVEREYMKNDYWHLYQKLDSISTVNDTIKISNAESAFDFMTDDLLRKGHAWVFDKVKKGFVDTISNRLEKYGLYAYRFFYLSDKRPFFSIEEISGILENDVYFSSPDDLGRLYDKLRETGK